MKNIFYNFSVTLKRFKTASVLNLLGLSVAFTIFIIVLSQLWWQYNYNDSIPQSEQLHMLTYEYEPGEGFDPYFNRTNGDELGASIPELEGFGSIGENDYFYRDFGNTKDIEFDAYLVSPSIIDLLGIKIIEGDSASFSEPGAIIIPLSMARQYFGEQSPIGELLAGRDGKYRRQRPPVEQTIVGVYADMPTNRTYDNRIYANLGNEYLNNSSMWMFNHLLKFKPNNTTSEKIKTKLIEILSRDEEDPEEGIDAVELIPMNELYFNQKIDSTYFFESGNMQLSLVLISVAFVILLIAVVNYINFFMSLVPVRIKAVNIAKVFGASAGALRANIIFEGIGIMALAFGFSLLWVGVAADIEMIRFAGEPFVFGNNIEVLVATGIFAIVLGAISGLFPAWYITKFSPSMILAGSFGRSRRGRALRSVLSIFQFTSSIVLVIVALFIMLQNSFMREFDYGYSRERLYKLRLTTPLVRNQKQDALSNELKKNPDITDFSYTNGSLVQPGISLNWQAMHNGEDIRYSNMPVSWNHPRMMGIELVDGRYFTEEDQTKQNGSIIFNETAAKAYNLKVGDVIDIFIKTDVVGIAKDFQYGSLYNEIPPVALVIGHPQMRYYSYAYIRISPTADLEKTLTFIREAIKTADPMMEPNELELTHFDESLEEVYQKEERLAGVITIFSFITILISLLGVMGTVIFDLQHRRKEVSVRKVFGASVSSILGRFNRGVLWILIISTLIGLPIAWYIISTWLENFTHRVPMHWWVFVAGVVIVSVIVFSLVTIQTWRAANANPTKYLKSE